MEINNQDIKTQYQTPEMIIYTSQDFIYTNNDFVGSSDGDDDFGIIF